jgi:hypothetical protein
MTDDFNLFDDPNDGDRPIDPDLALVSAYLARELSPMQVLAFEERLATDPEFRAAMQPLFDLWATPVASLESGAARRIAPLTPTEADAHWQRFLGEVPASGAAEQFTRRRIPMKRIAAVIAVTTLPMVTFAQVVLHAANNADAPGHTIARRIVAPFVAETPAPQPRAQTPRRPQRKTPVAPVPAPETTAVAPVQMSELTVAAPAQRAQPDRAKIAGLARQYQPAVVRGETDATYIVMVLDASENYLWSTAGVGNVSIEVGGDTRTPQERSAYTREYRGELTGRAADAGAVGRGGRGGGAGGAIATPVDTATAKRAILRMQGGAARGGGGGRGGIVIGDSLRWDSVQFKVKAVEYGLRQKPGYDSAYWVRFDSMKPGAVFARSGRGGRGGTLDTTGAVV